MKRRTLLASAIAVLTAVACTREPDVPAVLRVSAIPDQSPQNVKAQHVPIMELVCAAAQVKCEWLTIETYDGVVEALGSGRIDMAFLGGVTYVRARERHGATPLAIRDVDTRFSSTMVVREGAAARRLHDLKDRTLLFGNRSSTSGHVMARYFLTREGIVPETFFGRIGYADNHDQTLARIAAGEADAGIVNSAIALKALSPGGRYSGKLRVCWESPTYVDYVWAVRQGIPRALRERLANAFLDVNFENPQHAAALRAQGANGFLPALEGDYDTTAAALRAADAK